jgi:hypothetical protein
MIWMGNLPFRLNWTSSTPTGEQLQGETMSRFTDKTVENLRKRLIFRG